MNGFLALHPRLGQNEGETSKFVQISMGMGKRAGEWVSLPPLELPNPIRIVFVIVDWLFLVLAFLP